MVSHHDQSRYKYTAVTEGKEMHACVGEEHVAAAVDV